MLEGPNLKSYTLSFGYRLQVWLAFAMTNTEIKYGKNSIFNFELKVFLRFFAKSGFRCVVFASCSERDDKSTSERSICPPTDIPLLFLFFADQLCCSLISEFSSVCRIVCSSIHLCVLWAELQKIWHMFRESRKSDLNGKHMEKNKAHTNTLTQLAI